MATNNFKFTYFLPIEQLSKISGFAVESYDLAQVISNDYDSNQLAMHCYQHIAGVYKRGPEKVFTVINTPHISSTDCPDYHRRYLKSYSPNIPVKLKLVENGTVIEYDLHIQLSDSPKDVIATLINEKFKNKIATDQIRKIVDKYVGEYVLRVCGFQEYLLSDNSLWRYKIILSLLLEEKPLIFQLMVKSLLLSTVPLFQSLPIVQPDPKSRKVLPNNCRNLWTIDRLFKIKVRSASQLSLKAPSGTTPEVLVKCDVMAMGSVISTCETQSLNPLQRNWDEKLEFDLVVADIPHCAVIRIAIHYAGTRLPVAFINYPLFDSEGLLVQRESFLKMWPIPAEAEAFPDCLGVNSLRSGPSLQIEFDSHNTSVIFPHWESFEQLHKMLSTEASPNQKNVQIRKVEFKEFEELVLKLRYADPSSNERDLIWANREHCKKMGSSLAVLLKCVIFSDRFQVVTLYKMLPSWPDLSVFNLISLLKPTCLDSVLSDFVVARLNGKLTNAEVTTYLLQFVQTLLYEPYTNSPLLRLLLTRACNSVALAQGLFWLLLTELKRDANNYQRVLLVLSLLWHYTLAQPMITNQLRVVCALSDLSIKLKNNDELHVLFPKLLQDIQSEIENFCSPLEPSISLSTLVITNCRLLTSSKHPMWLTWRIDDDLLPESEREHQVILKLGDDLRQDMLITQLLNIMDEMWLQADRDLRILTYKCLPIGGTLGFIEVMERAHTVGSIFRKKAVVNWKSSILLEHLCESSFSQDDLVKNFTLSCAGYSVATFVLGIGDRHPDNIMVDHMGRIFHIDFGHFLGHKKKKLGITRERVPFVLPDDFVHVITKGSTSTQNMLNTDEFNYFKQISQEAFLICRQHSDDLLALFSPMIASKLSEIETPADINYLQETLLLNSNENPEKYFSKRITEARNGAWTTSVDWWCHHVKSITTLLNGV